MLDSPPSLYDERPAWLRAGLEGAVQALRRGRVSESATRLRPYFNDPVAFVHDCIEWTEKKGPAAYQDEILANIPQRRRVAVRAPHGAGKSTSSAWAILWFALTRDAVGVDWKLPTTASAWRQLTKFLWPEIHKWARRLRWDKIGREPFSAISELLQLSLKLNFGEAFAVASDTPELIEGAHADSIMYVFDEAKVIPDETFDAAEGAFSGAGPDTGLEAFALAISTPGAPAGRFYDIHRRKPGYEDWWARHVTLEETIKAKRVSRDWAKARCKQWGESTAVYKNRVLGEFASSEEDSVIPLGWVELANERWRERIESGASLPALSRVSLDVAAGGTDKTVLARCLGAVHVPELERFDYADTMRAAGVLNGILDAHEKIEAVIDIIGVGTGTYYRVREKHGRRAVAFNAAGKSEARDRSGELGFKNKRAEIWWKLREALDPEFGPVIELPPDDELTGDLTAPTWREVSDGKIQIESKEELRKPERLGRSPDAGDSVVQLFYKAMPKWRMVSDEDDQEKPKPKHAFDQQLQKRLASIGMKVDDETEGTCGTCANLSAEGGKFVCAARGFVVKKSMAACPMYEE